MKKGTYQITWTQNHHHQNRHRRNHRHTRHQRKRNATKKKGVVKTGNMTHQTHFRATIQNRPMTVITDASDIKIRAIRKKSDQIMRMFNGKLSDDSK